MGASPTCRELDLSALIGVRAEGTQIPSSVDQRLQRHLPALFQRKVGGPVHPLGELTRDDIRRHEESGGKTVRLALHRMAARIGIVVHDQVTELMSDVEARAGRV